jgi:Arc/MetJ-type ribon-helix-helix transcriptional regulator
MNFSVHFNDELVKRLNETAKAKGKTRNALIREAVTEWLERERPKKWPRSVMTFRGVRGFPRFEDERKNLKPPRDPFDAVSS